MNNLKTAWLVLIITMMFARLSFAQGKKELITDLKSQLSGLCNFKFTSLGQIVERNCSLSVDESTGELTLKRNREFADTWNAAPVFKVYLQDVDPNNIEISNMTDEMLNFELHCINDTKCVSLTSEPKLLKGPFLGTAYLIFEVTAAL